MPESRIGVEELSWVMRRADTQTPVGRDRASQRPTITRQT